MPGTWIGLFGYDALAEDARLEPVPCEELPSYRAPVDEGGRIEIP